VGQLDEPIANDRGAYMNLFEGLTRASSRLLEQGVIRSRVSSSNNILASPATSTASFDSESTGVDYTVEYLATGEGKVVLKLGT